MTLEVQIATHGKDAMKAILPGKYPIVAGISYRVGWQGGDESFKLRGDIDVKSNDATCLTQNRNFLINDAVGDIILFADNDISYTRERLHRIMAAFESNMDVGFICFKIDRLEKKYPENGFDMSSPVHGYYPSSCEIAVRTSVLKETGVKFDTRFGLGSRFIGCEETVFVSDLLACGVRGLYCPVVIGTHQGSVTTGSNPELKRRLNVAKGASAGVMTPWSGVGRLVVRAIRNRSISEFVYGMKGYLSVILHV